MLLTKQIKNCIFVAVTTAGIHFDSGFAQTSH